MQQESKRKEWRNRCRDNALRGKKGFGFEGQKDHSEEENENKPQVKRGKQYRGRIHGCPGSCWSFRRASAWKIQLLSDHSWKQRKHFFNGTGSRGHAVKTSVLPLQNEASRGEKKWRSSRIWGKEEPREIKAANYIRIRCLPEWVTQRSQEEHERPEMWGNCYKGQKNSAGRSVLNFPPKNDTPCRVGCAHLSWRLSVPHLKRCSAGAQWDALEFTRRRQVRDAFLCSRPSLCSVNNQHGDLFCAPWFPAPGEKHEGHIRKQALRYWLSVPPSQAGLGFSTPPSNRVISTELFPSKYL